MDGSGIEYETIRNLAALPNLTRLRIDSLVVGENSLVPGAYPLVPGEYVARLEAESFTPFANLQYLCVCVEEDAIICFARQLRRLEILEMKLLDSSQTLLPTLARLSGLRELRVQFIAPGSAIKALDLISMASSCRGLKKIRLSGFNYYNDMGFRPTKPDGSDIKDVDIRTVSSLLPNLEEIFLDCWGKLSVLSLHHLGRNCPRLRCCDLYPCEFEVSAFLEYFPLGQGQTRTSAANSDGPDTSSPLLATHKPRIADLENSSTIMQDSEGPQLAKGEGQGYLRPLFPNLKFLAVGKIFNFKNLAVPFVVSRLCSGAPRLEGISIERRYDQFAADLDDALDKLRGDPLFPRNV